MNKLTVGGRVCVCSVVPLKTRIVRVINSRLPADNDHFPWSSYWNYAHSCGKEQFNIRSAGGVVCSLCTSFIVLFFIIHLILYKWTICLHYNEAIGQRERERKVA